MSALSELEEFLDYWAMRSEVSFFGMTRLQISPYHLCRNRSCCLAAGSSFKSKATPNSVRNVEPASLFKLKEFVTPLDEEVKMAKYELGEIRRSQILQNGPAQ